MNPSWFLFSRLLAISVIFISPMSFGATSLSSDTIFGSQYFSETLVGLGEITTPSMESQSLWLWNFSLTTSTTRYTDSANLVITNRTNELNGIVLWENGRGFALDFGLLYSNTREEDLATSGSQFSLSYEYKFFDETDRTSPKNRAAFSPSLGGRWSWSSLRYVQRLSSSLARRTGVTRPSTGENSIRQTANGLSFFVRPWDWLKISIGGRNFRYDRDVAAFLAYVDSARSVRAGLDGLASAVSGLQDYDSSLGFTFYFRSAWSLDLRFSSSHSELDQSLARTSQIELGNDLNSQWRLSGGFQFQSSPATSVNLNPSNDTQIFVNLTYEFPEGEQK